MVGCRWQTPTAMWRPWSAATRPSSSVVYPGIVSAWSAYFRPKSRLRWVTYPVLATPGKPTGPGPTPPPRPAASAPPPPPPRGPVPSPPGDLLPDPRLGLVEVDDEALVGGLADLLDLLVDLDLELQAPPAPL